MAVSEQTPANSSTGNGVTTVFPYTFKILAEGDIEVAVDGVVKTLATHYTVSGVGDAAGGNVTFLTAPAADTVVTRRRDMAFVRTTDYQYQGDLPNDVLNADQDAPVLMIQQLAELVGRALKAPLGEEAPASLPPAADRANMFLVFDADGNPSLSSGTGADVGLRADLAASGGAALVSFLDGSVADKLAETVSVEDHGGGPSKTASENVAAFQKAITFLSAVGGGELVVPGPGMYSIDAGISMAEKVSLNVMAGAGIDMSGCPAESAAFSWLGSEGTKYNLTSNATRGSATVNVSAANLVASTIAEGDWLRIASDDTYDPDRTASEIGEIVRVASVDTGTGAISLDTPLADSYATADTAQVSKLTLLKGASLIGQGTIKSRKTPGDGHKAVRMFLCYAPTISGNIKFEQMSDRAIWLRDSIFYNVGGMHFEDFQASSTAYGISVDNACQDGIAHDFTGWKCRHLFTTNNSATTRGIPRRCIFTDFATSDTSFATGGSMGPGDACDTHAAAEDIHIWNGTIYGTPGQAVNFECNSGSIVNVFSYDSGSTSGGISVHNETGRPGRMFLQNVHAKDSAGSGVVISRGGSATTSTYERLTLDNVSGEDCAGIGVYLNFTSAARATNVTLNNVVAKGTDTASSQIYIDGVDGGVFTNLLASGSSQATSEGIRLRDVKNSTLDGWQVTAPASATGSAVYVNASAAGEASNVVIDGGVVKASAPSSLRGVLIDNNATKVSVGANCDLSQANTRISFGTGTGHISSERVLAASATAVSVGAVTTEAGLATISVPAGVMGLNSQLRVTTLWTMTNGADDKTVRVRLGGAGGTEYLSAVLTTAASAQALTVIRNRASLSSQVGYAAGTVTSHGTSSSAVVTSAVNTGAAFDIVISGQKETAGDTLRLESYTVEILDR